MATFDRTTIVRGPCRINYDTATFYSKGGVVLTMNQSTFDKEVDAYGMVGKAKTDMQVVVEFEPVGEIEALATLFPYASTAIGASIYGATDKALTITAADATYTIHNAAITSMPTLRCTANNTQLGSVQFTGLVKNSANPNALTSYYTASAGSAVGDAAFNPALIIAAPYTATLGGSSFSSSDGFEISFDLSLTPITVDGIGTVTMALANVGASITCTPIGVATGAFDTYFDALDAGEELSSVALDISTTVVGGLNFDAAAVQVMSIDRSFSPTENRLGTLTMEAKRTFTSGTPNALFTIAAVA